jgi:hypothetical protein
METAEAAAELGDGRAEHAAGLDVVPTKPYRRLDDLM